MSVEEISRQEGLLQSFMETSCHVVFQLTFALILGAHRDLTVWPRAGLELPN